MTRSSDGQVKQFGSKDLAPDVENGKGDRKREAARAGAARIKVEDLVLPGD